MSVEKYKIRIETVGNMGNDKFLKIPLSLNFTPLGKSEVIENDFIKGEVEKSINPILDYDKVKYTPKTSNGVVIKDLKFKLSFLDNQNNLIPSTMYSDIGFVDDDVKFRKNRFTMSFLNLKFFDSDTPTNQNLILNNTMFSRITRDDVIKINDDTNYSGGIAKAINLIPVRFSVQNPITEPEGFSEGYCLYHFKAINLPIKLYMRAEFNNAATGKTTRFITTNETLPINELINKLHIKYLLKKNDSGYYYTIDKTYNGATNIIEKDTNLIVNLFEIKVL